MNSEYQEKFMIYAVSKSVIKVSSVSIKSILILFILLQNAVTHFNGPGHPMHSAIKFKMDLILTLLTFITLFDTA